MTAGTSQGAAAGRELVVFRIATQEFSIDIQSVREIRGWTPATELPHAPSYVRGVVNLRGAILPIVDLAARLGMPTAAPTVRNVIIVVQAGAKIVGLLVDAVCDILTVADADIQPTPEVASEFAARFVRGVLGIDGRMISLISVDDILPQREANAA